MPTNNPVVTQALSAAAFIALAKALMAVLIAFHIFSFDENQNSTVTNLIEVGIPIVAIGAGAWWASRKVTPLAAPRDLDGALLTRPDNSPAIQEMQNIHVEAAKINDKIDKVTTDKIADERRIER